GFLGKANVFRVQIETINGVSHAKVAQAQIPLDGLTIVAGSVIVRPEKLLFSEPSPNALPGKMKTRVFQGNHWLCQVETSVGDVLVIRQNDGVPVPVEGTTVHLRWRAQDMRSVAASN
ncbi:MAG TPA: ABC transporter ATP-binding protein, partial [Alcaligenaceae bacterium]|nr:ABC transporter ATP-binding protein [Alcaligenaceae bacterium]